MSKRLTVVIENFVGKSAYVEMYLTVKRITKFVTITIFTIYFQRITTLFRPLVNFLERCRNRTIWEQKYINNENEKFINDEINELLSIESNHKQCIKY